MTALHFAELILGGFRPTKPAESLVALETAAEGVYDPSGQRFFEKQVLYGAIEKLHEIMSHIVPPAPAADPLDAMRAWETTVELVNGVPELVAVPVIASKPKRGWPKGKPRRAPG